VAGIATIRGTAIAPGVSRNKRLYTKEMLGRSVARAREAIARGEPHTMLTHHGAEGDSTRIVGRVTSLEQRDDGRVTFEAEIADTAAGRDIAALVTGDEPFLDGVSIRGAWRGKVRRVQHDGQMVETADDLDLFGLDFTKTPGVLAARIERGAAAAESAAGAVLVYESVTEATAAATKRPYGDVRYADIGYRDGVKRYPIDTKAHARAAWSYINQSKNARLYTAQQLKRIKSRIRAALTKFGVDVTAETAQAQTRLGEITEFYPDMGAGTAGGLCIDAHNGPVSLTVRVCGIDPAELRVIATAAMDAACDALTALDPDLDGDIDLPGAPHADTDGDEAARRPDDNDMETAPAPAALAETTPTAPAGETTTPQEVPAVSEQPITPAAAAETATPQTPAAVPQTITLTQEQFQQLLAARPVAESTPAAPEAPAPAAPAPVAETEEQRIARIVSERMAAERKTLEESLRAELRQQGPARKGLTTQTPDGVAETTEGTTADREAENEALLRWVSNGRYTNQDA
jgi:hypothetical protein